VQVCPTGIDIRKGLQYECIGCAACIDGCDQVMDKMGYPKGLIRYTTQNALAKGYDTKTMWRRVFRFRTVIYSAVLLAVASAAALSLATRNPLRVDILRDRGALAREASPGIIENVYRVQIMNTDETARRFSIRAEGFPASRSQVSSSRSTSARRNPGCSPCGCARRRPTTWPRSQKRSRIPSSSSCRRSTTTR
jgi:polyferredoxin